jgi:hypothetical protein
MRMPEFLHSGFKLVFIARRIIMFSQLIVPGMKSPHDFACSGRFGVGFCFGARRLCKWRPFEQPTRKGTRRL